MSRVAVRRRVTRVTVGQPPDTRADLLAGEEPLQIRVNGTDLAVTMRTPGHDVELAAGFLVSEGVVAAAGQFATARYCAGTDAAGRNTYNVLDVTLGPGADAAAVRPRAVAGTAACGLCGTTSIEQVRTASAFDVRDDPLVLQAADLAALPERLREQQKVFDRTGGLHAAALFDAAGSLLVLREDIGRHNAVDKVIGWALTNDLLPLRGHVLLVSGRAGFELVQKAVMAGIPMLAAVSAPSSLAAELAAEAGLTLVGFLRGSSMVVYSAEGRIADTATVPAPAAGR